MSRKTCVRFVLGCLLTVAVGIAANASADQVGALMLDSYTTLSSYSDCSWQPIFSEARVLNSSGSTVCSSRAYQTGGWQMAPCNSTGSWVAVNLRTENTLYCSTYPLFPGSGSCQASATMRRNGEWQSCPVYSVTAYGWAY